MYIIFPLYFSKLYLLHPMQVKEMDNYQKLKLYQHVFPFSSGDFDKD